MKKIKELIIKYKGIIKYGIFGLCSTLINFAVYYLLYNILHIPNVIAVAFAWISAVVFAFLANKLWVFESKSWDKKTMLYETITFFSARILTGLLDMLIMFIAVDVCHFNSTISKCVSNVIVIIINYIASKLIIFKKKK